MGHCHAQEGLIVGGGQRGARRDVAAGVKAAVCDVAAAHAPANRRDVTPVRAGIPRVGEDENAPRDGALLGCAEAPAARRGTGTGASRGHRTACRHGHSRGRAR